MLKIALFISIAFTIFCTYKFLEEIYKGFKNNKLKLRVTYTKLIKEVINYSGPILYQNNIKYFPFFKISYYNSKKKLGCYLSSQKKIVIYIKSHYGSDSEKINDIIHTTLHEIRHYMQHFIYSDFKNYDNYTKNLSYKKNPFEIDSNSWADKNMEDCIQYLKKKGVLY